MRRSPCDVNEAHSRTGRLATPPDFLMPQNITNAAARADQRSQSHSTMDVRAAYARRQPPRPRRWRARLEVSKGAKGVCARKLRHLRANAAICLSGRDTSARSVTTPRVRRNGGRGRKCLRRRKAARGGLRAASAQGVCGVCAIKLASCHIYA